MAVAERLESTVTREGIVRLALNEVEVPEPGPGEVVIRVEGAPINPSDLGVMLAGADPARAELTGTTERPVLELPLSAAAAQAAAARVGQPLTLGNEGAGTVIAAGPGAEHLMGKVVSVTGGGMYAQLRKLKARAVMPLPDGVSAEAASASFINPMTALSMVETALADGHTAIVHTAAASRLGQMLDRLCRRERIPLVNIVRSPGQVELLRQAGAEHVCDSRAADFDAQLAAALKATGATVAFDATGGGELVDRILGAMEAVAAEGGGFDLYGSPVHKQVYIYGSLDDRPTSLGRRYGMSWSISAWLLPRFLVQAGPDRVARMRRQVVEGLSTTFTSEFSDRVSLAGALSLDALAAYGRPATGTKFLITPNA